MEGLGLGLALVAGFDSAGIGLDLFLPEEELLYELPVVDFAILGGILVPELVDVLGGRRGT